MAMIKFEVRLSPQDAECVLRDMAAEGTRRKADHLRACLLAGRAGRADLLAEQLGLLGMALNTLSRQLAAADPGSAEVARLVARATGVMRAVTRALNGQGR